MMTHSSLFSGIGGFDLAAEWAGLVNIFQVEYEDYLLEVLKKNFPNIKKYKDIKRIDFSQYRYTIDIISGGFPCQPYSRAGHGRGSADDRDLWGEMLRVIQEIKPGWVIGENVTDLVNFLEFENIISDLESEGYEVQTFSIPAMGVGAVHKRYRIWIVANTDSSRFEQNGNKQNKNSKREDFKRCGDDKSLCQSKISNLECFINTDRTGLEKSEKGKLYEPLYEAERRYSQSWYKTAAHLCGMDDGLPFELDGLKFTKSKVREERLKGLGNAVVPQIPYIIFESIQQIENEL